MDLTDTGEVSVPRSHDHLGLLLALLGGLLLAATPSPEPNAPASDDTGSDRPRALDPALDGEEI